MKVGIYVPMFDERPAGLGVYMREVASHIAERVDETPFLFTTTPGTVPASLAQRFEVVGLPGTDALQNVPGGRQLARLLSVSCALPVLCRLHRVDALLCLSQEASVWPWVPQISVVHDLTPLRHPSPYFSSMAMAYTKGVLPTTLRHCARVVAVSRNTRADLIELLGLEPEHVEVVSEGFDTDLYGDFSAERVDAVCARHGLDGPYLLYSGTFAGHKNVAILPELLAECRARGLDLTLAVTGRTDAGARRPFEDAIDACGVREHVRPLGYVDAEDLGPLMAGAFAFVFPSMYEGFGLAPLEAMASGAVVLSSDRASLPEVVGDGGFLLDPRDVSAWADTIASLWADPELARRTRAAGRARAALFSWEDTASSLLSLASSFVPKRRGGSA